MLDAEILADVYLLMTGGQVNLNINQQADTDNGEMNSQSSIRRLPPGRSTLAVIRATDAEVSEHNKKLVDIKLSSGVCIWQETAQ